MNTRLTVSASPHAHSSTTSSGIMLDVIIALAPALIASIVIFGTRMLVLTAVCVAVAVLAEYIFRKLLKRSNTIGDLSAIVTGIILALNLPVTLPFWMAAIGSIVAIIVVKQLFGGIGQNFVNPAMTARIILMVSFPTAMGAWTKPFENAWSADAVTTATPMSIINGSTSLPEAGLPNISDMLFGVHGGSAGEVCSLALIIGGLYLIVRRVISPVIPLTYIGTVGIIMLIASGDAKFVLYELLGGGLMLGAFFMATDYATSPITPFGKLVFGIGCGLITSVIRLFGSLPEGVSFSIVIMNILVPHIENLTLPRAFGTKKPKEAKKI